MDSTSTVSSASSPSQKKSRHLRKGSFFKSFSGDAPSSPQSLNGKGSNHKATLTLSHIDKPSWNSTHSSLIIDDIDSNLRFKPSHPAGLPRIPSPKLAPLQLISSLDVDLRADNHNSAGQNFDDPAPSQWELETTSELDRVQSGKVSSTTPNAFTAPASDLAAQPPSAPVPLRSTFDPGHSKQLSTSSFGSLSSTHSNARIRSKHTSTASTISTLRHFSIISVETASAGVSSRPSMDGDGMKTPIGSTATTTSILRRSNVTDNLTSMLHDDLSIPPSPQSMKTNNTKQSYESNQSSSAQQFKDVKAPTLVLGNLHHPISPAYSSPGNNQGLDIPGMESPMSEASVSSPLSLVSNVSYRTTPNFTLQENTLSSKVNFKDDTQLGQNDASNANMLSYKRDRTKYRKTVSKASISLPTGLVDCETHFTAAPDSDANSYKRGHRSKHSVMSSISTSSFLKPFKRDPSPTRSYPILNEPRTPQTSTSSVHPSDRAAPQHQAIKKHSFADVRRSIMAKSPTNVMFRSSASSNNLSARKSFLGFSSFAFPSGSSADAPVNTRTIISLPTPNETSREKLKNKLRASSSLLSLTRPDAFGSLAVAVPVEQHNHSQVEKLLGMCNVPSVLDFQTYIYRALGTGEFEKITESSFSDVYLQESTKAGESKTFKIIPFGNEELDQSPVEDILQELGIARHVMSLDGFLKIFDVAVVKGKYPSSLLSSWDKFRSENDTLNARPDAYIDSQLYCVVVQAHAGTDLETYELDSWADAESVFWQTVAALAQGEEQFQFEHRDLHWGNIMISDKPDSEGRPEALINQLTLSDSLPPSSPSTIYSQTERSIIEESRRLLLARSTLKITLTGYALSRANSPDGGVLHRRMDHPEFYRGKGDYQFDIYRYMRSYVMAQNNSTSNSMLRSVSVASTATSAEGDSSNMSVSSNATSNASTLPPTPTTATSATFRDLDDVGVDWSTFCPSTNVLWLHYLVDKLLNQKELDPVPAIRGSTGRSFPTALTNSSTSLHETLQVNSTETGGSLGAPSQSNSGTAIPGGGRKSSSFEGDLLADEARARKCLETIARALDPRKKRMGGTNKKSYGSSLTFVDFASANDVLKWGIKAKVFPAYASMRV